MFAIITASLQHKSKKYVFSDSCICNIESNRDGYGIASGIKESLVNNMLKAGVYSSERSLIRAIKSGTLIEMYSIKSDINKLAIETNHLDTVSIIEYDYYPNTDFEARYEIYGNDAEMIRKELSDYDTKIHIFDIGTRIRFKYKNQILDGIISAVPDPDAGRFGFSNLYDVLIQNGKSYDLLYDENQVHHDDIFIVYDDSMPIKELHDILVANNEYFRYTDEYLNSLLQ